MLVLLNGEICELLLWDEVRFHDIPAIKIGSGIQKLMGGGEDTHADTQEDDLISVLLFFQNNECRLKISKKYTYAISILSVCLWIPPLTFNAWNNLYDNWHVYHGTWAHLNGIFHKPSHQSICLYVYHLIVARQRFYIHVPKATNTRNKEELLDASFSVRSVSYHTRVGGFVCIPYGWKVMAR
jgi:hypothetical protein